MARYKLILAYDGAGFCGSQRQARRRTVQGELEEALRSFGWQGRAVLMAGRTDTGVHASGQVAAFDLDWGHGESRLLRALNARLPSDMAGKQVAEVADDFHPRFDARWRRYTYRLFCSPVRDPLQERQAWRVWPEVSSSALRGAARLFLGKHDFSGFGSAPSGAGSTIRSISRSGWSAKNGEWQYSITCDAFLYRMVRRIVYVQVAAGQSRCSPDDVRRALMPGATRVEGWAASLPAGLAPAHGLSLSEVSYGSIGKNTKRRVESVQDVLSESR
jgi:tRNA pseudouridine38-40 synthase